MSGRANGHREGTVDAPESPETHEEFMARYRAECERAGEKVPTAGDFWAWAFRGCHRDLWPARVAGDRPLTRRTPPGGAE